MMSGIYMLSREAQQGIKPYIYGMFEDVFDTVQKLTDWVDAQAFEVGVDYPVGDFGDFTVNVSQSGAILIRYPFGGTGVYRMQEVSNGRQMIFAHMHPEWDPKGDVVDPENLELSGLHNIILIAEKDRHGHWVERDAYRLNLQSTALMKLKDFLESV